MLSSMFYSRPASPPRKISSPALIGNHVDKHDAGLRGEHGAQEIVKLLRLERSVKYLVLAHNRLGDAGCVALFDYLRSEDGKKHEIVEISLNANKIGDAGLWAISRYLEGNKSLGALFLQNNAFQGDHPIMLRFTLAVNRSNLHTLSLTCNASLANAISTTFLPNLDAPMLKELHLSVCSLGPSARLPLLSYLTSKRSWGLHTMELNGNPLGLSSVSGIVTALERTNLSICWIGMQACCLQGASPDDGGWKTWEEHLRTKVLERNRYLRKKAEEDALFLLPHARATLLPSTRPVDGSRARLPTELLIHILSFLALSLSPAQHLRVCEYAASPSTLPKVGLSFPPSPYTALHAPRPASLSRFTPRHTCRTSPAVGSASAPMKRLRSPMRDEEHKAWLKRVGCDRFELVTDQEPEGHVDGEHTKQADGGGAAERATLTTGTF